MVSDESNGSGEDKDLEEVDRELSKAASTIQDYEREADAHRQKLEADARVLIAKRIITIYLILVGIAVVFVVSPAIPLFRPWPEIKESANFLLNLMTTLVLPVVTLVIGYFFGKDK